MASLLRSSARVRPAPGTVKSAKGGGFDSHSHSSALAGSSMLTGGGAAANTAGEDGTTAAERLHAIEEACMYFAHEVQVVGGTPSPLWVAILVLWHWIQALAFPLSRAPAMPWRTMPLMSSIYLVLEPLTLSPAAVTTLAG
jgi:hypothetical protein